jgi:hypothetical protein
MVTTNFPNGATSYGVPLVGSGDIPVTNGNYWFVDSAVGSDGNIGSEADLPFATLKQALVAAVSNNGDVIVLLPGHNETISAAGGITVNKIGINVIGMGEGAARPTITFSTSTAATFLITAASFSIQNVVCICNIASLVTGFAVQAADCTLGVPFAPVEWHDTSATVAALRAVLTTAAAARLNINMNYFSFTATTVTVDAIRLVGVATANITINFYGAVTTAVVEFFTTACTNIQVYGYMYIQGDTGVAKAVVDTVTGSTWYASFFDGAAGVLVNGGSSVSLGGAASVAAGGEQLSKTSAAIMSNALTLFTVSGAPIEIVGLVSLCITPNGATASTVAYNSVPTVGTSTVIASACTTIASAPAGASITATGNAVAGSAQAAIYNANGPGFLGIPGGVFAPVGTITITVAVGSTTGTWQHFLRWKPMGVGASVVNAF